MYNHSPIFEWYWLAARPTKPNSPNTHTCFRPGYLLTIWIIRWNWLHFPLSSHYLCRMFSFSNISTWDGCGYKHICFLMVLSKLQLACTYFQLSFIDINISIYINIQWRSTPRICDSSTAVLLLQSPFLVLVYKSMPSSLFVHILKFVI